MFAVLYVPQISPQERVQGPKIDVLRYKVILDRDAQIEALQTCQADALCGLTRAGDIEKLESEGFTVTSTYGFNIFFIGFNVRPGQSPLDDVNFRHALAHSVDKIGILLAVGGYIKVSVDSMVPPTLGGWHNPNVDPHPFNLGSPFDVTALVADAPAGQAVTNVTDASIFEVGDSVWIADETAADNWELNTVAEVDILNNKLTMENDLTNTYTVAADGVVAIHDHSTCSILREARYKYVDAIGFWLMPNGEPVPPIHILTPPCYQAPQSYEIVELWIARAEDARLPLIHEPAVDYFERVFVQRDFDAFVIAFKLDRFPAYLYNWFHSTQDFPGGGNAYGVQDPDLDVLLETIRFHLDHDEMLQACWQAQEHLANGSQSWGIPVIPVYNRHQFDAFKPGLLGIVKSPGYGADNMWTYLNIHWALGTPRESVVTEILGDEPDVFNPFSCNASASWKILDRVFDSLLAINPYTHQDIRWLVTDWAVAETPTGMDVTYYLRDDVFWHDGWEYNATHAKFSLEFIRDWHIPRLRPVWQNIVDVEVIDAYTFTVHANATSLLWVYDWAIWATRLPSLVWDRPWSDLGEILSYNLSGPYDPAPSYEPGPTPPPTNLFGTGPFIFQFYNAITLNGNLTANRNYFLTTEEIHNLKVEMFHRIGDVNRDGYIDIFDLSAIGAAYGTRCGWPGYNPDADLNEDCIVDARDLAMVTYHWGDQREYPVPTEDP